MNWAYMAGGLTSLTLEAVGTVGGRPSLTVGLKPFRFLFCKLRRALPPILLRRGLVQGWPALTHTRVTVMRAALDTYVEGRGVVGFTARQLFINST